jgi:uncharacterized protein (DUF1684 family)
MNQHAKYSQLDSPRPTKALSALLLSVAVAQVFLTSCAPTSHGIDHAAHAEEIKKWQAERLASLTREDGWLTLIGLFWLKDGENRFGSDPSNDIILPAGKASAFAGSIKLEGNRAKLTVGPGVEITSDGKPVTALDLQSDADSSPTILQLGSLTFHTIRRGDKTALRVRDKENPARTNFKGLEYFPIDGKWRVIAQLERYDPPKLIPIMNVLGMQSSEASPGALVFEVDGQKYRLDPIVEKGTTELFIIFADQTKGKETYGAGRYVYAHPPDASGKVVVDFNRAYSPPCAFTNFATCPLPPEQNRLPVRIEAGEKFTAH